MYYVYRRLHKRINRFGLLSGPNEANQWHDIAYELNPGCIIIYKLGPNANAFALALEKSFAFYRSTAIEIVPQFANSVHIIITNVHIKF